MMNVNTERLYGMAVFLHIRHAGLPANVWVSEKNASDVPAITIQRNKGTKVQVGDSFDMTICDSPSIIGEVGSDLSAQDIDYFKAFVRRNRETLLAYWNGVIDTSDLVGRIVFENDADADEPICEMANRYKEETQLPMNIWIDESRTYVRGGHGKRIVFQLDNTEDLDSGNCGSMDFDGNISPSVSVIGKLDERELISLRNFVHNNRYALDRIADQDVRLYRIWPDMIKGGEVATEEAIKALKTRVDELAAEKGVMNRRA